MFRNILRPDSPLMITMTQITDCIFLSLFWLVGCIPVVTVGASSAALYDAVFRCFRQGEKHCWHRFLDTFRSSWKAALIPTGVFLAAFLLLAKGLIALWNSAVAGLLPWMAFSGLALIGVLLLGILNLLFPVLSRFENSLSGLLKNTVFLAMANLPLTLGLGLLHMASILLCLNYIFPVFFLPALAALLSTLFIEPMFRPFLPREEPEA